jgi:4'-phosphopantetheinyl transferase
VTIGIPPPVDASPDAPPPLAPREVHVWVADLDAPPSAAVEAAAGSLSEGERARASRFADERGGLRFSRSRALLRTILGGYLDLPPAAPVFGEIGEGKPVLVEPPGALRFNLSHCASLWLLAVARDLDVGIDGERIDRALPPDRVAERIFSPMEVNRLAGLPPEARIRMFFRVWTAREAVVKLRGEGIFTLSVAFDVVTGPDGSLDVALAGSHPAPFALGSLPLGTRHEGALAVDRPPERVRTLRAAPHSPRADRV